MELTVTSESFALAEPFVISRGSRTEAVVVTVQLRDSDYIGWGECTPYPRYNETVDGVIQKIRSIESDLLNGLDRAGLQDCLPSGAARNAVDCALWDLESKRSGCRVFELANLPSPVPLTTAYTLSLGTPSEMCANAEKNSERPLLKVKLGGEGDIDRLHAIRAVTSADIIVDANEGWSESDYSELAPILVELGVHMVEQPFPADADDILRDIARPLPVCADESCHDRSDLSNLHTKYDIINIKLDKTGGLTEALALREEARAMGFGVMVGCMIGTSLAMAPAVLVGQGADFVDLDGALLLSEDRPHPLKYDTNVYPSDLELWG